MVVGRSYTVAYILFIFLIQKWDFGTITNILYIEYVPISHLYFFIYL